MRKAFLLSTLLLCVTTMLWAQTRKVEGTVTGENGAPVVGASVTLKGTSKGTTTNAEGKFAIDVPSGKGTLVVNSIGFADQEISLGSQSSYAVRLLADTKQLDDVVVVGYGKANRKALTSAITSIRPADMNRGPITDVGVLLQGKVPGLNITASGDPNRNSAIILRGASTINSPGNPFFVIDGVPGADIALVAPDDIATIDVLRMLQQQPSTETELLQV